MRNFHVVFWDRSEFGPQRYELRGGGLEITDNGAPVKRRYIVYQTTYLLPVNNNLPLQLFWSKLQHYYIMISE